jgi:asparagine synthase (glutamine-hydrolysing)
MCGICGIVHADAFAQVDAQPLEAMNAALTHRGPDDEGMWVRRNAGLAARRLSILDVEHGHQPMLNENESVAVVLNGEIYNFMELRDELESKGYTFRTRCDTEVVLRAYEAWGDDALERFNGMFALAVYDGAKKRLLLARDRLGVKPLFYTERDGVIAFSSELNSLMKSGLVSGTLNPSAITAYFSFLYVPAPDCILADAKKLRPAQKLVWEKGRAQLETYWRPVVKADPSMTLDSAAEAYRELLNDSIRLRRVSDVPLGAFLSGGIDSSSVVAGLSGMSDSPVKTFSIGFDDAAANELPYARAVAERFGTDHTEAIMTPDLTETVLELIPHFGEPFADSSALPTYLVSKLARETVTVALSGDGGDELFAGYTWLHMNRTVERLRRVPKALRALAYLSMRGLPTRPMTTKVQRVCADTFLSPRDSFRRRETCFPAEAQARLLSPELRARVAKGETDRFEEHAEALGCLANDDWMLWQDMGMYLPDDILTKVDRVSMAASLEVRVPLLDHRIVEWAATVPFALKLRRGVAKRLVKRAWRGVLPPEILAPRKRGFAIPIQRWFREELGELYRDTVLAEDALSTSLLDGDALRVMLKAHASGRSEYGHHLWAILMFELWLRFMKESHGVLPEL